MQSVVHHPFSTHSFEWSSTQIDPNGISPFRSVPWFMVNMCLNVLLVRVGPRSEHDDRRYRFARQVLLYLIVPVYVWRATSGWRCGICMFRSWSPTHKVTLGARDQLGKDPPAAASGSLPPPPSFIKSPPSPPATTEAQHQIMFHQGNLQSGISAAIQEQKLVGIFVQGTCVLSALIITTDAPR
jgi:hypothetical protein